MELYLHPNTPSWRGAQLKYRVNKHPYYIIFCSFVHAVIFPTVPSEDFKTSQ
jgi:hypothetical protein